MSVTLSYPYTSPTDTVTMRNPELGDSDQLNIKLTTGRNMQGEMYVYKKTLTTRKLLLDFRGLTDAIRANFVNFFLAAGNAEIKFVDWDANTWKGHIINNPAVVTQDHQENSSITVEFIGAIQ